MPTEAILTNVLELGEHRITKAFTGETALAHQAQDNIDITFFDVMLPRLDGIDVLWVIRELQPNARIVLMTDNMPIGTYMKQYYSVIWIYSTNHSSKCSCLIKSDPKYRE